MKKQKGEAVDVELDHAKQTLETENENRQSLVSTGLTRKVARKNHRVKQNCGASKYDTN